MHLQLFNELTDDILKLAKPHDDSAKGCALAYVNSDNKADQTNFRLHSAKSEVIREVHKLVCQHLHYFETVLDEKELNRLNELHNSK